MLPSSRNHPLISHHFITFVPLFLVRCARERTCTLVSIDFSHLLLFLVFPLYISLLENLIPNGIEFGRLIRLLSFVFIFDSSLLYPFFGIPGLDSSFYICTNT